MERASAKARPLKLATRPAATARCSGCSGWTSSACRRRATFARSDDELVAIVDLAAEYLHDLGGGVIGDANAKANRFERLIGQEFPDGCYVLALFARTLFGSSAGLTGIWVVELAALRASALCAACGSTL